MVSKSIFTIETTMAAQVLPKELRLQAPATMPQARSYLFKQQSTQSTYTEGQTIQINIPRLQRSYLTKDSYLKFQVQIDLELNKSTTNVRDLLCFDTCGALGLIDKIEVFDYLGSTLLESTSGHAQLMALLLDMSVDNTELRNHYNQIIGTQEAPIMLGTKLLQEGKFQDDVPALASGGPPLTTFNAWWNYYGTYFETGPPLFGKLLNTPNASTSSSNEVITAEFSFPLFSFLGLLSTKYAPLHNGYTINITLNTWANALSHTLGIDGTGNQNYVGKTDTDDWIPSTGIQTATSYVKNVYFCSQVLELGPVAESMLLSSTGGQPLIIPSKAYRNYVGTIASGQSQYRLDLNLNVASLTNVMFIMRQLDLLNSYTGIKRTLSGRTRNFLESWYLQYGSSVLPQTTGISCRGRTGDTDSTNEVSSTEAYAELMKSRHKWVSDSHAGVINSVTFNLDTYGDATTITTGDSDTINQIMSPVNLCTRGTFAGGLDLELVSGRSNDLICGMNTNGMNTSIFLNFDTLNAASIQSCRMDAWCEYDSFINISPGIATTVSF